MPTRIVRLHTRIVLLYAVTSNPLSVFLTAFPFLTPAPPTNRPVLAPALNDHWRYLGREVFLGCVGGMR